VRLTRIYRNLDWLRRNEGIVWEIMARLVRHQLISAPQSPPSADAKAIGAKQFADLIDWQVAWRTGMPRPRPILLWPDLERSGKVEGD
jgi:hypothetical protein